MFPSNSWLSLVVAESLQSPFLSLSGALSVCSVSVSKFLSSSKDANHIGFRTNMNPVLTHFNLITAAKTLFPNKAMFTGSGWMQIWGEDYLTHSRHCRL